MLISITYVTLLKRCSTRSRKREERGKIEERWERTRKLCLSESELRARDCRAGLQRDFCPRKQRLAPYAALFRACVSTLLISYRNAPCRNPIHLRETNKNRERERESARQSERAGETRVMQNVLIVREEAAVLVCRAPESRAASCWQNTRKTPNVHWAQLLFRVAQLSGGLYLSAYTASALLLTANPRYSPPHGNL